MINEAAHQQNPTGEGHSARSGGPPDPVRKRRGWLKWTLGLFIGVPLTLALGVLALMKAPSQR